MFKRLFSLGLISTIALSSQVFASSALEEDIYPLGDAYIVQDTDVFTSDGEVLGTFHRGDTVNVDYQKQDYGVLPNGGMYKLGMVSKAQPVDLEITYDGIESENYLGFANEIIAELPEKMIKALNDSGCKVIITDYDIGKDNYYGEGSDNPDWAAVTVTWSDDHSIIYVEHGKLCIEYSLLHEIGHAIDFLNGEVSSTDEFMQIYLTECTAIASEYFKSTEKEYFAEAFSMYYNSPERRANMPQTYAYIDNIVSKYD